MLDIVFCRAITGTFKRGWFEIVNLVLYKVTELIEGLWWFVIWNTFTRLSWLYVPLECWFHLLGQTLGIFMCNVIEMFYSMGRKASGYTITCFDNIIKFLLNPWHATYQKYLHHSLEGMQIGGNTFIFNRIYSRNLIVSIGSAHKITQDLFYSIEGELSRITWSNYINNAVRSKYLAITRSELNKFNNWLRRNRSDWRSKSLCLIRLN